MYEIIFKDESRKKTVNRGKIHKYLGMTIYYKNKGLCKIMMFDYTKEILDTFDKIYPKVTVYKLSAAPANLFFVRDGCTQIETKIVNSSTW